MSDIGSSTIVQLLNGLGLAELAIEKKQVKRLRKTDAKRFKKLVELLEDVSVFIVKQTPACRLFLWDVPTGTFLSVFNQPHIVFKTLPLDLSSVDSLWNVHIRSEDRATATVNEKLYELIKLGGLLPLHAEPGNRLTCPSLNCFHMVYLDEEKKCAYFLGQNGQTTQLESAMAPFINFTKRSRAKSHDFLVAGTIETLMALREKLRTFFASLDLSTTVTEKKHKKQKKEKKHSKKSDKPKKAKNPSLPLTLAHTEIIEVSDVSEEQPSIETVSIVPVKKSAKAPRSLPPLIIVPQEVPVNDEDDDNESDESDEETEVVESMAVEIDVPIELPTAVVQCDVPIVETNVSLVEPLVPIAVELPNEVVQCDVPMEPIVLPLAIVETNVLAEPVVQCDVPIELPTSVIQCNVPIVERNVSLVQPLVPIVVELAKEVIQWNAPLVSEVIEEIGILDELNELDGLVGFDIDHSLRMVIDREGFSLPDQYNPGEMNFEEFAAFISF